MIRKKNGTSYIYVGKELRKVKGGEVVKELDLDDIPFAFQDQWEEIGPTKKVEEVEDDQIDCLNEEIVEVKLIENGKKVDIATVVDNKVVTEKPLFKTHAMKMIAERGWVLVK